MSNRIVIVDEDDRIIGHIARDELYGRENQIIYRVSVLWITNPRGDILLAQRALTKKHHPGKWGPAVAGTVDEGETYEDNVLKEAEEELGLTNIQPQKSIKRRTTPAINGHNHFTQWYTLVIDKPAADFTIQKDEVEQVRWFTRAALKEKVHNHPEQFVAGVPWGLENL